MRVVDTFIRQLSEMEYPQRVEGKRSFAKTDLNLNSVLEQTSLSPQRVVGRSFSPYRNAF